MPVNGLMVTLSADLDRASRALDLIDSQDRIERGDRHERWLPVVVDSRDENEARELHRWLENLTGVDRVDVILVTIDENNP